MSAAISDSAAVGAISEGKREDVSPVSQGAGAGRTFTPAVLERAKLDAIARHFELIAEDFQDLGQLQHACFVKILHACEDSEWEKINGVLKQAIGITDSFGRTLLEALAGQSWVRFAIKGPAVLCFQGGGEKGLAYLGIIDVFERRNLLSGVESVIGASAGAITATLVALRYTYNELFELLVIENPSLLDFAPNNKGLLKGEKLLEWIEDKIFRKTGIHNCTFGELRKAIEAGRPFKHLNVAVVTVENPRCLYPNSRDKMWDQHLISHAIRASAGIPGVFPAHFLRLKNGESSTPFIDQETGALIDGGSLGHHTNLPMDQCDRRGEIDPESCITREDRNKTEENPRALALSLTDPRERVRPVTQGRRRTAHNIFSGFSRLSSPGISHDELEKQRWPK